MGTRSRLILLFVCLFMLFGPAQRTLVTASGPITAANASQIKLLSTLGFGAINDLVWSPDHRTLAVGTQVGLRLLDARSPQTAPRIVSSETVRALAFSADGKLLVAATETGIQLWDTAQWQPTDQPFGDIVNSVAFSPDGKTIAASSDHEIQLWDVVSRQTVGEPFSAGFSPVAFSPDGKFLVRATLPLEIWDLTTHKIVITLADKTGALRYPVSVTFSADGGRLAAADNERVALWAVKTGAQIDVLSLPEYNSAPRIEIDSQGRLLLTSVTGDYINSTIVYRNVQTRASLLTFQIGLNGNFGDLAFSPDGTLLTSLRHVYRASISIWWDVKTGAPRYQRASDGVMMSPFQSGGRVSFLSMGPNGMHLWEVQGTRERPILASPNAQLADLSPDGTRTAISFWDGSTRVIDTHTGDKRFSMQWPRGDVPDDLMFSPDGKLLLVGGAANPNRTSLVFLDTATGKQQSMATLDAPTYKLSTVVFSPDAKTLAITADVGQVLVIDVQTGKVIQTFPSKQGALNTVRFSADGTKLAYGALDLIRLWDVQTGKLIAEYAKHVENAYIPGSVDFTPDGNHAAFMYEDTVQLIDTKTGNKLADLTVEDKRLTARFSPDGSRLVVTYADTIQLWDSQSGKQLLEWSVPDTLSFWQYSPDGDLLITATMKGIVQIWDPATGKQLAQLKGHHAELWSLVFSPDRSLIATSSDDGTVRLWGLDKP